MAILDIRQRAGSLFLVVMLGHILLISAQVNSRSGVPVLETVTFGIFAEVQRAASSVLAIFRGGWTDYVALRRVKAENDGLKQELASAKIQLQEQRALAARTRELERMLDLRDHTGLRTAAAEIIAASATPDFRTLTIDKGTRDGLRPDMAVIAPEGVVGRIVVPSARAAKVQLLIDRNAAAGAMIERSRAQGIVIGAGDDRLRMDYLSDSADVVIGDVVATSGIDGIFPKGFIVGRVEAIEKSGGGYKRITVKPAVDFSRLEGVLVVMTPAREAAEESSE